MNTEKNHSPCPLCNAQKPGAFYADKSRSYLRCQDCQLVFVPADQWLSTEQEKATYDLHENDVHDQGYRQFLARLSTPLLARLPAGQRGLDFGCGPGPALAMLLEEKGHQVELFDPFYYPDQAVLAKSYDFICATEVVEHLRDPNKEFTTLFRQLKAGGCLAIMTKLVVDEAAFRHWHYIRDLTHICFYSQSTLAYIARRFQAGLDFVAHDVILMHKK